MGCIICSSGASSNPLPDGGDLPIVPEDAAAAIDAADPVGGAPFEPLGEYGGFGHASASSGGAASRVGGQLTGNWSAQAIMRNGEFSAVLGGAFAAMQGDTGGEGKSKHLFVYLPAPEVESNQLSGTTTTTTVQLKYGWSRSGDEDENLNIELDSEFNTVNGQLEIDDSGDMAIITGTADAKGFDFLIVRATIGDVVNYSRSSPRWDGRYDVLNKTGSGSKSLTYLSANYAKGDGQYGSQSSETTPQNAEISSDLNAFGYELLRIAKSGDYDQAELLVGYGIDPYGSHTSDTQYSQTQRLFNRYRTVGKVDGTLHPDDSVTWQGNPSENVTSSVMYRDNYDQTNEWKGELANGSDWSLTAHKVAEFDRQASRVSAFDAATGEFTNAFSVTGDKTVGITGLDAYYRPWTKTFFEEGLEKIYTEGSEGYPTPPPSTDPGELPPDYVYPSNPSENGWFSWFGGSAGDSADQVIHFTTGVADSMTFNISWATRKLTGMDRTDYDGTAYYAGGWTGTVAGFLIPVGVAANRISNSFDDAGRCVNWLTKLRHGGCFVAGTLVTVSDLPMTQAFEHALWDEDFDVAGFELEPSPVATAKHLLVPIEEIPLGARVPTKNPRPWEFDDSLPEPEKETWAKISITMHRSDGGVVDAELIRPKWWVKQHGLEAGKLLPMNIEELQVHGAALVTDISSCPVIAGGDGSVITGRFLTREVNVIVRAEIIGPDGDVEVVEGTPVHPIWSADRQDWVPLCELEEVERLQAADGFAVVASVVSKTVAVPVYNVEVHGEHGYQVGSLAALVHNAYLDDAAKALAKKLKLNADSPTTVTIIENIGMRVENFVGLYRQGKILKELPEEVLKMPIEEAIKYSTKVRKLLTDGRFAK